MKGRYIEYPVRSGDTLHAISQKFGVTTEILKEVNNVGDPKSLQVGQLIYIPYHGQSVKRESNGTDKVYKPSRASSKATRQVKLSKASQYIGKLYWPVRGKKTNSKFGWRWFSFHEGIDIAASSGTSIYAAHSGKVVYSGSGIKGYGNMVVLRGDGLLTVYAHNRSNLVKVGQTVKRGSRIATVGASGKATGPHLHFETRVKDGSGRNVAVDPLAFY